MDESTIKTCVSFLEEIQALPRVNVMLPEDLLAEIDQVAREEGMNRSKLLRTAVMVYFHQRAEQTKDKQRQDDIQRAMAIQDHLRQTIPSWDGLKILQEQRENV